ncbi:MAG: haloacid dehalogenase-like hydrolase [Deltaproteobacteria bacterium]|nr:haloacid dehalogenase-like hydrolase [Deltaproteobacteria bacterium]
MIALNKNCNGASPFLPTQNNAACADLLLNIYNEEPLESGTSPWKPSPDPDRILPSYAFYAQLFQGYTPKELRSFTEKALALNLKNKIDTKQKIGTKEYTAYVRIYTQMKDLIGALQRQGFDVWIISASIQPTVEVAAKKVGVAPDHVIGVRQTLSKEGTVTDAFEGCGPYPHGTKDIWSYRLGKRCWLNKVVFKIQDPQKMLEPAPILFAAGDSDTDFFFLKDATEGRLVINRNKAELLCHAYHNADGKWLVNPMFIHPKPQKTSPYSCSSFQLPDQADTVFGLYP